MFPGTRFDFYFILFYFQILLLEVNAKETLAFKRRRNWGLPGGPVVKTMPSNARDAGLIPGQGAKILYASWPKHQNVKQTVL